MLLVVVRTPSSKRGLLRSQVALVTCWCVYSADRSKACIYMTRRVGRDCALLSAPESFYHSFIAGLRGDNDDKAEKERDWPKHIIGQFAIPCAMLPDQGGASVPDMNIRSK